MALLNQIYLVLFLLGMGLCITPVAASLDLVLFPLKSSPASGPYQDEEFLRSANTTIYSLSNTTVPNGTALYDLQTTQQVLSKMNISPELYPNASRINDFLYYTGKAGYEYEEVLTLIGKPYSPVYDDRELTQDATTYYTDAKVVWNTIKDLYPGVTLYSMPVIDRKKPYSVNEDDTKVFPRGTPTPLP